MPEGAAAVLPVATQQGIPDRYGYGCSWSSCPTIRLRCQNVPDGQAFQAEESEADGIIQSA